MSWVAEKNIQDFQRFLTGDGRDAGSRGVLTQRGTAAVKQANLNATPFLPITSPPGWAPPLFRPIPVSVPFQASSWTQHLTASLLLSAAAVPTNYKKVKTAFCIVLLADYWACSVTRGDFDYIQEASVNYLFGAFPQNGISVGSPLQRFPAFKNSQ